MTQVHPLQMKIINKDNKNCGKMGFMIVSAV
jgi:hypothetical protein